MAESWPRARLQVLQNSGSQMLMLRVKPLSAEMDTGEKQEKNIERVQQYESARVSALTRSVPRKTA